MNKLGPVPIGEDVTDEFAMQSMSTHTVTKLGSTPSKCKCHIRGHYADTYHGPVAFLAVGVPTTIVKVTKLEVEHLMELLIDTSFAYADKGIVMIIAHKR